MPAPTTAPTASQRLHRAARRLRIEHCRRDVNAFAAYVARDEETGEPIRQGVLHRTWHQLLDRFPFLIVWSSIASGKSWQVSILRSIWLLGRDPSMRIVLVSNAEKQASKWVKVIAQMIERDPRVRQVFPRLRPGRGGSWNQGALTIERPGVASDPSIQCVSLHGNILSSRVDLVVADDVLDYESVRTPAQREDTCLWFHNAILGRLSVRGRVCVLGCAQHREDLMHFLAARSPPWAAYRFGVLDDRGRPRWPQKWPIERVNAKRLELGPAESARQLDCRAGSGEGGVVKLEYLAPALERGRSLRTIDRYPHDDLPYDESIRVIHGVDLGAREKRTADMTCIFSIAVHPNRIRQVLSVQSFRLIGQARIDRLAETHRRYGGQFVVENNSFQQEVVESLRGVRRGVWITPRTTGRDKASLQFQVDRLVAELSRGDWAIPSVNGACEPEISRWIDELLGYDPGEHVGDRLAACCLARWGADEGSVRRIEYGHLDLMSR